jgi:hypothetical protein
MSRITVNPEARENIWQKRQARQLSENSIKLRGEGCLNTDAVPLNAVFYKTLSFPLCFFLQITIPVA